MPRSGLRTSATSEADVEISVDPPDDLFGFAAAQKRLEERQTATELEQLGLVPWRVFVNHIDSYHGKILTDYLPEQDYVSPEDVVEEAENENENEDDEENEENDEEKTRVSSTTMAKPLRKFEVIGTVIDREYPIPEGVIMIIKHERDRESFLPELMKCGVIIYDITQDNSQIAEAQWALEAIARELEGMAEKTPKAFGRSNEIRRFILISTIMTWSLTKPLDPDDPELPFTEADYRKRKPHPNFKEHVRCEKDVVVAMKRDVLKNKLKTVVLCCGVTYGSEEGPLHYLFQNGWNNDSSLPVFGRGDNKIALLHVRDLATIVSMFLRSWPKLRYVVAVERELASQKTIVKSISKALTTGKLKMMRKEEAFLLPNVTQRSYDMMTTNLRIIPAYIVDRGMHWHSDLPFGENIQAIAKEYRIARKLRPVKLIVLGPPASGKTRVAQYLAKHYRIHYVSAKMLIDDTIREMVDEVEAARTIEITKKEDDSEEEVDAEWEDEEERDEEDDDEDYGVEELQDQLDEIRNNLSENNGRLSDDVLNKVFKRRLMSKKCQNQGYVIDGYPKTIAQARGLFGAGEEDEEEIIEEEEDKEEDENASSGANKKIMPELVVCLEASDEFLIERMLDRPEKEIQGTHYTEEQMIRRLGEYRERNSDENTPLQFFDELEVHPLVLPIEDDLCPDMFPTFHQCLEKLGKPRNYGPTVEEMKDAEKRAKAEEASTMAAEEERKTREALERKRAREEKMMEWTDLMEKLKQEEEEKLCILGEPLRHYLVKYVFPTLTQGLIEVARLRPEDPVDFLAEYLFKENPEGKMFEPDYTETMSTLLTAIEKLQDDILLPCDELDKGAEKYLKTNHEKRVTRDAGEFEKNDVGIERSNRETSSKGKEDESEREFNRDDEQSIPSTFSSK